MFGTPDQHLAMSKLLRSNAARIKDPAPALKKANSFLALAKATARHVQAHRQRGRAGKPPSAPMV
jgi:hypothetical protein